MQGCRELDIELGTAALAFCYFERLILKGIITKTNRRLAIATSLVLAYKWNERGLQAGPTDRLPALLQWLDRVWYASAAHIFRAEFGALSHLNFALHVPLAHAASHFFRILKDIELPPKNYLGEAMLRSYAEQAALEGEEEEGEEEEEGREKDGDAREGDQHAGHGDEEDGALSDSLHDGALLLPRRRRSGSGGSGGSGGGSAARVPAFFAGPRTNETAAPPRQRQGQGQGKVPSWALRWRPQGSGSTEEQR